MVRVIMYDEAYEIFNIERFLNPCVTILGYIKNDKEYFKDKVFSIDEIKKLKEENFFDYIIINTRRWRVIYNKLIEFSIDPKYILDVSFFFYDNMKLSIRDNFIKCTGDKEISSSIIFLGRNYIKDSFLSQNFNDYMNLSSMFSDIHYDYHLFYYLVKRGKLRENNKVCIFMNYSMLYDSIKALNDRFGFINLFEEIFKVHNNINVNNVYFISSYKSFKENFHKIFKEFNLRELNTKDLSSLSKEDIKYNVDIETISYKECNTISFVMNKNILNQYASLIKESKSELFFIIPPVCKPYRTYINKTLKKEFYMVLNPLLNKGANILDYFDLDFSLDNFSSPTTLNEKGVREFLKMLYVDINNKDIKACNNL